MILGKDRQMNFSQIPHGFSQIPHALSQIPHEPVIALIVGILILAMPRLLPYVIAIYLIVIGTLGVTHGLGLL